VEQVENERGVLMSTQVKRIVGPLAAVIAAVAVMAVARE
jgi:hypothetical protein